MAPRLTSTSRTSTTSRVLRGLLGLATAVTVAATLAVGAAAPASAATQPPLKPVLGGLLDRHKAPADSFRGAVDSWVAEADWAGLQPVASGPITTGNPIDQAILDAKKRGVRVKVRVYAGTGAPEWAKRLDGTPVAIIDEYGNTGTVGRFWTKRFGDAYTQLQQKLAARYDTTPQIAMVSISRCTTMFAEPFLRQGRTPESVTSLLKAGYTATADELCQRQQVDAHKAWTRTRSGLSFNPYQRITASGATSNDVDFAKQMMGYCRDTLGQRCVLENHSIRSTDDQGPLYDQLYAAIKKLGGPIGFQTATPDKIGDMGATLKWAVQQGAAHVELPISYKTDASPASLVSVNRQLTTIATAAVAGLRPSRPPSV